MPKAATNRRVRRPSVALMAPQSAKGTLATDFRFTNSVRLWTTDFGTDPAYVKSRPGPWMTELVSESEDSRYSQMENPESSVACSATPETIEMLLRSNWGPYAAGAFTLKSQVNEWFTLAWVEDHNAGSTQNLIRTQDCFFHRVRFRSSRQDGKLYINAEYMARANDITPLNSLGGIQLPPSPMAVQDTRPFGVRNVEFIRDPLGANVSLLYETVEITFDQIGNAEWTQTSKWDVWKTGKTIVYVSFEGMCTDESWAILNDNRSGAKKRFQLTATSEGSPSSIFAIDIRSMDFELDRLGHDERGWIVFKAFGRALVDSGGAFVGIVLS